MEPRRFYVVDVVDENGNIVGKASDVDLAAAKKRAAEFAAAPEMYELLKMARKSMTAFGGWWMWMSDLCLAMDALLARIDGDEK